MSIGNLKNDGNKGNNFPWQLKMLLGQQCACDELTAINANTDNVEFLLTSILTSLQAQTDYEARFVLETCPGPITRVLLEVRIWDQDSGTWGPITYYLPGSSTPETIGAGCTIEYTDPNAFLAQILAELQLQTPILTAIEVDTTAISVSTAAIDANIDVPLSTVSTEVTLAALLTAFNLEDFATETTLNTVVSNTTGAARTPNAIRTSASGDVTTVAATFYSVSVANVGNADGNILGGTLLRSGEILNFDSGSLNNTFNSFAYDATGTEFIITFIS
tara:strand:- start:3863 stop:4690 length:828 start_codon:yes stop_codon:yes gene_type:complete